MNQFDFQTEEKWWRLRGGEGDYIDSLFRALDFKLLIIAARHRAEDRLYGPMASCWGELW